MAPLLNIAVRAARRAGDLIVRHLDRLHTLTVNAKQHNEFVSEVDRMAEADIIRTVQRSYPDHAFNAEESGRHGDSDTVWVIDPLDGTTNFLHGFPVFAVSIAVQVRGQIEHAVVYDPMRQELFTATRGSGALLDDRRIRVSQRRELQHCLIGTGFPFREGQDFDAYLEVFKTVMQKTEGVRRPGAAALDLAYVAAGRLDGFYETGLKPWDMAAGALIIREAGGIVSDLSGGADFLEKGHIVTGGQKVHAALQPLVKSLA